MLYTIAFSSPLFSCFQFQSFFFFRFSSFMFVLWPSSFGSFGQFFSWYKSLHVCSDSQSFCYITHYPKYQIFVQKLFLELILVPKWREILFFWPISKWLKFRFWTKNGGLEQCVLHTAFAMCVKSWQLVMHGVPTEWMVGVFQGPLFYLWLSGFLGP